MSSISLGNVIIDSRISTISFNWTGESRIVIECIADAIIYNISVIDEENRRLLQASIEKAAILNQSDDRFVAAHIDTSRRSLSLRTSNQESNEFRLEEVSHEQKSDFLLKVISSLKTSLGEEKQRRSETFQQLQTKCQENNRLAHEVEWLRKEVELLKHHGQLSAFTEASSSHCISCNCTSTTYDDPKDTPTVHAVSSNQEDARAHQDDIDQPSTSTADAIMQSASLQQDSKDLLVGIAQHILCQLCPQQYPDVKDMESHFLKEHMDEGNNCTACPTGPVAESLSKHILQHTNRIYLCEFCGKRGRKNYLKSHLRVHTRERPFECAECGRNFGDQSTLRRHRLVHTGEKKHSCPICGRGIARKDNVKVHIRSHGVDC